MKGLLDGRRLRLGVHDEEVALRVWGVRYVLDGEKKELAIDINIKTVGTAKKKLMAGAMPSRGRTHANPRKQETRHRTIYTKQVTTCPAESHMQTKRSLLLITDDGEELPVLSIRQSIAAAGKV